MSEWTRSGGGVVLVGDGASFLLSCVFSTNCLSRTAAGSMNVYMLVSILSAGWVADALGCRATLVLANHILMAGTASSRRPRRRARCVASVLAFVAAFSVGLGPVVPTYSSEVMPLRLRAQGTSLGTAVNRLACGGGDHDVHLPRRVDHHGRVLLPVCRCGGRRVGLGVRAAAGDQRAELGGHGGALHQVMLIGCLDRNVN